MNKYCYRNISNLQDELHKVKRKIEDTEGQIEVLTAGSESGRGEVELVFKSGRGYTIRELGTSKLSWKKRTSVRRFIPFLKNKTTDENGATRFEYEDDGYTETVFKTEICENKKALADAVVFGLNEILSSLEKEKEDIEFAFRMKAKSALGEKTWD